MSETFQSSKFKYLSDPPVVSRPFSIEVDQDKCIGCGVCIKQCPCQTVEMVKREKASLMQEPACQHSCPAGTDIREYLKILDSGASWEDCWRIITETNPLPAVTGRVCPHPCEDSCNRTGIESAVNIHSIERAIGDFAIEQGLHFGKPEKTRNEKVAIIGSGPSGMSCAYQLARKGYQVTVFESESKPGGMLNSAIPHYRLPEAVVEKELGRIIDLGITMKVSTVVGKDVSLDDLKKEFNALYVALGAQNSTVLGIKGEEGDNIVSGLAFLKSIKENNPLKIGKKVLVIGGGNTAVDAARSARRMGCDVTILYRRTMSEMPAYAAEVEAAQEEGIIIDFLCAPVNISGNGKGTVTCQRMELGNPDESGRPRPVPIKGSVFDVAFDTLIAAIGQDINASGFEVLLGKSPWISIDTLGQTQEKGVFAGGDAASGPGMVSEAIGAGRKAALAIDAFITGKKAVLPEKKVISYAGIPIDDRSTIEREESGERPVEERLSLPDAEVNLVLGRDQVLLEAKRCLSCGMEQPKFTGIQYFGKICIACHNCEAICPNDALTFSHYYKINEGRFANDFDYPQDTGEGFPNPLRIANVPAFTTIESQITPMEKVIYTRRSTRIYKKDPVPKEMIERVLEAGRFAPSAGNCQGWKFVVLTDQGLMNEMSESVLKFLNLFTKLYQGKDPLRTIVKKTLPFVKPEGCDQRPMVAMQALITPKFGDKKLSVFFDAPVAILVLTHHHHISDPGLGIGICAQNMILAAHSLGLGTCYVGFVSTALNMDPMTKKKFRSKLGIEWPYDSVGTVFTLGYPAVQTDKPVEREFPRVQWVE